MKLLTRLVLILFFTMSLCEPIYAHDYAMSYLFGGTSAQYENNVQRADGALNTVAPDYFEIDSKGNLKVQKLDSSFISSMQSQGISVTPFISNHWDRQLGITALDNSSELAGQIAKAVYDNKLDGVNVDIENVSHTHRDAYTRFVKELRAKMPDKIIAVAVAANPHNWQTGWHGSYDYAALASHSDYLMIMAYDESYTGSAPGPVASSSFVEKSILYALQHTTKDKLVLGIPFFGRFWQNGASLGGYGVTNMDVENLLKNYTTTKKYHTDTQSAQVTLTLKSTDVMPKLWGGRVLTPGTYDIWYGDLDSIKHTFELVEKYGLRGSGSWAMGQEDPAVWPLYAKYKSAPVTGITVTPGKTSVAVKKTKKLAANVTPSSTEDKTVKWKSHNTKIAKVSSTGTVTGIGKGTVLITATSNSSGKTAVCNVTVTVPVSHVILSTTKTKIKKGKTKKISAYVKPTNASNKKVTWKSSNKRIATVTSKGTIKGIRKGTAKITVKTSSGGKTATCRVTVY